MAGLEGGLCVTGKRGRPAGRGMWWWRSVFGIELSEAAWGTDPRKPGWKRSVWKLKLDLKWEIYGMGEGSLLGGFSSSSGTQPILQTKPCGKTSLRLRSSPCTWRLQHWAQQSPSCPRPRKMLICAYLHNTPRSLCDQLSSLRSALRLLPATAAPQPSATPSVLRPLSATERGSPGTPGFLTSGANAVLTPEPLAQLPNISPRPLHSATPKFSASMQSFLLRSLYMQSTLPAIPFPPSALRGLDQGPLQ